MLSRFVSWCFIVLLAGCASTREAEPLFSTGYKESRVAPDVFVIRYSGSMLRGRPEMADGLMLRAAQLTQRTGSRYFAIIGLHEATAPGAVPPPQVALTSSSVYGIYGGGGQSTVASPSQPAKVPVLMIRTFRKLPPDLIVSNASNVEQAIRAKYNLPAPPPARRS